MRKNDSKRTINDLVDELESLKVDLVPSRDKYLEYVFEFCCQDLERQGYRPGNNTNILTIYMKAYIQKDIVPTTDYYKTYDRPFKLVVPKLSEIPKHLDSIAKYS